MKLLRFVFSKGEFNTIFCYFQPLKNLQLSKLNFHVS